MRPVLAFLLSILLLAGSVLPHVSAERLPGLIEHYHEHQREEGGDVTILHFLWEHYAADAFHHKHPNHSHSRLPVLDCHAVLHLFMPPLTQVLFSSTSLPNRAIQAFPRWENRYAFAFARTLLNPPKEP